MISAITRLLVPFAESPAGLSPPLRGAAAPPRPSSFSRGFTPNPGPASQAPSSLRQASQAGSNFWRAELVATALFLAGCATGLQPEPVKAADATKSKRPASELVARGREAAARGDAVRAEQYFGLAIEEGADRRVVLPMLLQACVRSSHLRAALNQAEPYLLEHPEDDALRYLVATIHLGLGQPVAARRELGLLLQRNDSNPEAHYLLGIIDSAGNVGAARAHFLEVLRHSKDDHQKIEVQSRLAELTLHNQELVGEDEFGASSPGGTR